MKTDGAAQSLCGRKQSLIGDARRERGSAGAGSPGPARPGEGSVFVEEDGRAAVNVLFTLSDEKHAGLFKTGKIFEVSVTQELQKKKQTINSTLTSFFHYYALIF